MYYVHQGDSFVLKSVSVQGDMTILPLSSSVSTCANVNDFGAGPRNTFPMASYVEPWQGHSNFFSNSFHGTMHPRCEHSAFNAKVNRDDLSSLMIRYVGSSFKPNTSDRSLAGFEATYCSAIKTDPNLSFAKVAVALVVLGIKGAAAAASGSVMKDVTEKRTICCRSCRRSISDESASFFVSDDGGRRRPWL